MGYEMGLSFIVMMYVFFFHGCAGHVADIISPGLAPVFSSERPEDHAEQWHKKILSTFASLSRFHGKAPARHDFRKPEVASSKPLESPLRNPSKAYHIFASPPSDSYHKHMHHHHHHHAKNQFNKKAAAPVHTFSPFQAHHSSIMRHSSHAPALSPTISQVPNSPPSVAPLSPSMKMGPAPSATLTLPPPPPNQDCTAITCTEPFTSTPSGYPCGCVRPIQVRLQLDISLYTFFPLVSELAKQIAATLLIDRCQVRVMGAKAASQQIQKTILHINLVPLEGKFSYTFAFLAYDKFWHRKIKINSLLFGAYDVLDVQYPGLPPSPPSVASNAANVDDHPYPANFKGNGGSLLKPLGVDVPRKQKNGSHGSLVTVIIISSITAFVICAAIVWVLILRYGCSSPRSEAPTSPKSSSNKQSGAPRSFTLGRKSLSESLSFASGMLSFTGSAKVFSLHDMEKATNEFDALRVLGEGGFGVVYEGVLIDGEQVAVKVLKRDNRQGVHEFLSEVEMLSRLHHRNLVKLIGICTEEHFRCLVYELVPNGNLESHLHGIHREVSFLDWPTRMKIALGAARGLAYLHEDSSPCVIHRDFKSSNILLGNDYTPKVSDFGLARNALNEGNQPISTHVIGTFGYLAPEYAMTGHLLVKSDVYSYGVVLLELLTGRKPVDFSKPPGEENLVTWAHPLLTTKEGLETIMDPTLKASGPPYESFSKVAAIASMCVQPEVSRRPFMGEVVQALELVCSEFDDANEEPPSGNFRVSVDEDSKSSEFRGVSDVNYSVLGYESRYDPKTTLSGIEFVSVSEEIKGCEYESLGRNFSSGHLGYGKRRKLWQRLGRFSRVGMKESLWPGSP